jgi:hypothetical protein
VSDFKITKTVALDGYANGTNWYITRHPTISLPVNTKITGFISYVFAGDFTEATFTITTKNSLGTYGSTNGYYARSTVAYNLSLTLTSVFASGTSAVNFATISKSTWDSNKEPHFALVARLP